MAKASVLSHPRGLYVLFFTEMWERFSFYGMRALLVPYMLNALLFQPQASSSTYKWYTSLVYLTPLLGGFLADRFLGLRASIVVGGILMALGHFLMAFEPLPFFYAALAFLIVGNGFFKPNISTLVGKLYTQGDARRDGAFTIFYMGINLGAFLAPVVCGFLRQRYGAHAGFAAAGVGMMAGLVVFLLGQKRVMADVAAAGNEVGRGPKKDAAGDAITPHDPEEDKPSITGVPGIITRVFPFFIVAVGVAIVAYYAVEVTRGKTSPISLVMPIGFLAVFIAVSGVLLKLKGAARDKSTVIFVLFGAAVLFWMAFEQAGNTLNIWAVTHTELRLGSFEYPAEWFQSVNALLILALGLVFAAVWVGLAKRGKEPSTPVKMMIGLALVAASFVPMVLGAASENATVTSVELERLPERLDLTKIDAGRLTYENKTLSVRGVLPLYAVNDALRQSADPTYLAALDVLEQKAATASAAKPEKFTIEPVDSGFVYPLTRDVQKLKVVRDGNTATSELLDVKWLFGRADFVLKGPIDAGIKQSLVNGGAPAEFRRAVIDLEQKSQGARVSGIWLVLSYLIATLGELCLSPVGLSMVTKLAPARFASLFMGVWLLASSVAQYAGGTLGETWGKVAPRDYFQIFVWVCAIGAAVLLFFVRPLRRLMHDVK